MYICINIYLYSIVAVLHKTLRKITEVNKSHPTQALKYKDTQNSNIIYSQPKIVSQHFQT